MAQNPRIKVVQARLLQMMVLHDKAVSLGDDFEEIATDIQARISRLQAQLAQLQE